VPGTAPDEWTDWHICTPRAVRLLQPKSRASSQLGRGLGSNVKRSGRGKHPVYPSSVRACRHCKPCADLYDQESILVRRSAPSRLHHPHTVVSSAGWQIAPSSRRLRVFAIPVRQAPVAGQRSESRSSSSGRFSRSRPYANYRCRPPTGHAGTIEPGWLCHDDA
jgi:hypothetical protein